MESRNADVLELVALGDHLEQVRESRFLKLCSSSYSIRLFISSIVRVKLYFGFSSIFLLQIIKLCRMVKL